MKSETTREIAKQVVAKWKRDIGQVVKYERMEDDIEAALNAERERCAKIAEDIMPIGADDCYWCERVQRAAAAIRGKD